MEEGRQARSELVGLPVIAPKVRVVADQGRGKAAQQTGEPDADGVVVLANRSCLLSVW